MSGIGRSGPIPLHGATGVRDRAWRLVAPGPVPSGPSRVSGPRIPLRLTHRDDKGRTGNHRIGGMATDSPYQIDRASGSNLAEQGATLPKRERTPLVRATRATGR